MLRFSKEYERIKVQIKVVKVQNDKFCAINVSDFFNFPSSTHINRIVNSIQHFLSSHSKPKLVSISIEIIFDIYHKVVEYNQKQADN